MRKPVIVIGLLVMLVLLVGAGVYSYFGPQLTLRDIRNAAKEKDTEKLRDLIDFDSVRASLKDDFRAMVTDSATEDLRDNPFAAVGVAFASALIDPMIDSLVSPSSIVRAVSTGQIGTGGLQTRKRSAGRGKALAGKTVAGSPALPGDSPPDAVRIEGGYSGYSRYRFTIRTANVRPEDSLGFVLKRQGLFSWRLSRIVLPESFFHKGTDHATSANDASGEGSLESLAGQYPRDIFKTEYGQQLRRLIGPKSEAFEDAISVADVNGISDTGTFMVGSGCLPHSCDTCAGAFAIDKASGGMYAIMMENGRLQAWGVSSMAELPPPLQAWARERNAAF